MNTGCANVPSGGQMGVRIHWITILTLCAVSIGAVLASANAVAQTYTRQQCAADTVRLKQIAEGEFRIGRLHPSRISSINRRVRRIWALCHAGSLRRAKDNLDSLADTYGYHLRPKRI